MVNEELVRKLLKELEAEKGCPVQLRADTPQTERYANTGCNVEKKGREYFGQFEERGIVVKRVCSLAPKYKHDVSLIEGEYSSLIDLHSKIAEYNIFYCYSVSPKVVDLFRKTTKKEPYFPLSYNFRENAIGKKKLEKILQKNGITYFNHRIAARPEGVYDDRTYGGSISIIDETKIADITLKLIE